MRSIILIVLILASCGACTPCREFSASVAASAEALEPYTVRGVYAALQAGDIGPETAAALKNEAGDLTRSAKIAAGGER